MGVESNVLLAMTPTRHDDTDPVSSLATWRASLFTLAVADTFLDFQNNGAIKPCGCKGRRVCV